MASQIRRRLWQLLLTLAVGATAVVLSAELAEPGRSTARPVALAETAATWPTITVTSTVHGLSQPLHITHAGDGSGRLFVVEKAGLIRIVRNGVLES
ncbi:MAG: hypothetical protein PVI59_05485, partial [Anaerolineae bacterium]